MSELLAVGKEFKSFEELQEAVYRYEQASFTQLSRTDSRTVTNEESRRQKKSFNPAIRYCLVTFTCVLGGKPYISRSTGIRNTKTRIKCNCPVTLKCYATVDGQRLVVRQSDLDCHNHEQSEESFKALPRGKLLDEETELEIFNLIQSHENKKLARKLVKDKLIEETGRDITYKDILNIEKRMSKRKEILGSNGRSEDDDVSDASVHSDQEMAENEENDEGSPDKAEQTPKALPKKKTSAAKANTQTRSSGRPKRAIREPTRFRDPSVAVSSSVLKRRMSESENSWEESDSESNVKKETQSASKKGRPRKVAKRESKEGSDMGSDGDQLSLKSESKSDRRSIASRQLEMEEKRLKMQEEMLNLQRQSMMLLQHVVQKLDQVDTTQKTAEVVEYQPLPAVEVEQNKTSSQVSDDIIEKQSLVVEDPSLDVVKDIVDEPQTQTNGNEMETSVIDTTITTTTTTISETETPVTLEESAVGVV